MIKTGISDFDKMVEFLIENGYEVNEIEEFSAPYYFVTISGKGVRGGMATANAESYKYINHRVCFDSDKCFDKWSKCPYSFPIPMINENNKRIYILSKLEYIATEEGYEKSNDYNIPFEEDYTLMD